MGKLGSCLRPPAFANLLQLQSLRQRSRLKGAKHLSGGKGAISKIKYKSWCLQKSKLVDWGGQPPSPGASPELLDCELSIFLYFVAYLSSYHEKAIRALCELA